MSLIPYIKESWSLLIDNGFRKQAPRAGAMAQAVKHPLCKHKDLHLDSQHPYVHSGANLEAQC